MLFLKVFPETVRDLRHFTAFLTLFVAGCAAIPELPEAPETFVLSGKVGVREANESFSANLLWHQKGEAFEIDLWGPLGQGRTRIVKKGGEIQLLTDQGVLAEGRADRVMHDHLGWSLPLDVLPAWVQGEPFPTVPVANLARDEEGRVTGFSQLGWVVVLERYQSVEEGLGVRDLPTRITASRADARVRLVISEWRF